MSLLLAKDKISIRSIAIEELSNVSSIPIFKTFCHILDLGRNGSLRGERKSEAEGWTQPAASRPKAVSWDTMKRILVI
jgi:hypothetical protein